jgi:hypothetical protein
MNVALKPVPLGLVIYYRLDEDNTGTYYNWTDSASNLVFNPVTMTTPIFTVPSTVDMREIYLVLCPEGSYVFWDLILGYYVCEACDSACQNCIGSASDNCTSCNLPYTLLWQEYECIMVSSCPIGYYQDPDSGLCFNCYEYCAVCSGSATVC